MELIQTPQVQKLIDLAIEEDLGEGDVTSRLSIDSEHQSEASILAREDMRVCGLSIISAVFSRMNESVSIGLRVQEGSDIRKDAELARLSGNTRALLAAERIVLNFLQRMCGVATHVQHLVDRAEGLHLLDTRKTIPGWRLLDKYAVFVGGAKNHRAHLGEMILVKDNHIDASKKSIPELLEHIETLKPEYMPVEVEVRSMQELEKVLEIGCDIVMLDNMGDEQMSECLEYIAQKSDKVLVEVSGGITQDRFSALSNLGVKRVSLGSLTTQARNVDISMNIRCGG